MARDVEASILRRLPELLLAGTVPPALAALLVQDELAAILAVALITAWWLSLLPLAFACLILTVLKGPMRRADSYPMPD
jgi:hypothetical protein